jgi:hypothetical protein
MFYVSFNVDCLQFFQSQNEVEIKDNRQENDIQTVEMDQTLSGKFITILK